ncbi:DNA polymerase theta-like [Osmerus eperlanus]|uniref:DNA polymerase theta-like n=3 Tax=Osmerus eperlanus TaxID=29151 RepID=UPI002E0EBC0F
MPNPDSPSQSDRVTVLLKRRDERPLSSISLSYSDVTTDSDTDGESQCDEDCDHSVKPVQDKRLNRVTDCEVQDILSPSVSVRKENRANLRKRARQARAERHNFFKMFEKILQDLERDADMEEIPNTKHVKDVSAVKIQRQDLSEIEITSVVPLSIEDATDSTPLTPPTPEVLLLNQQVPQAPLNCVTVGVVTPSRPETPPAVGCLPHSRLPPITNLSTDAKKLLQGGLDELQQDMTKQTTGKKKAKAQSHIQPLTVEEDSINNGKEKKKKNPTNFEIQMATVVGESPPSQDGRQAATRPGRGRSRLPAPPAGSPEKDVAFSVSMRHAFVPFSGGMILAADYSQLELRVLAHLSKDRRLLQVLNGGVDVFRCIAAEWKNITPDAVKDGLRQQAKQICYGIIYGMGAKSLGEQMGVDENDAACYIESFKARYTGIQSFLRDTVKSCVKKGYVQTLLGRRRYLPGITNGNTYARAHAERQAVNTTVQGSAADIVKLATVNIQQRLQETFPTAPLSHQHPHSDRGRSRTWPRVRGAYFILQLHDELIYETTEEDLIRVAQIVKREMESAVKLYVKLRAKVRVGPSWGDLQDMEI